MHGYGEILTNLRGNRSRGEVADACGISVSAIGMYESEERVPRDDIKIKLARFYKKTVGEIFFANECHEMRQNDMTVDTAD